MMVPFIMQMPLDGIASEKGSTVRPASDVQRLALVEHQRVALEQLQSEVSIFLEAVVDDASGMSVELSR